MKRYRYDPFSGELRLTYTEQRRQDLLHRARLIERLGWAPEPASNRRWEGYCSTTYEILQMTRERGLPEW